MLEFRHHFRAMGTEVGLWLWQADEQLARSALIEVEDFFTQTEARLSRFQPQSELSRLNRAAGRPFSASRLLFELVEAALCWRDHSDGIFDPTVLNALLAHGYDRSFETLSHSGSSDRPSPRHSTPNLAKLEPNRDRFLSNFLLKKQEVEGLGTNGSPITLNRGRRQISLPPGVGLDLGGIAKGWAVQYAATHLGRLGPALVDAGGDIACVGRPPGEPAWTVGVSAPENPQTDLATLFVTDEAVATSSRARRRWQHRGRTVHHLIDPRTGEPAKTDLVSVTVIAPRLPAAEIHAKVILILGEQQGLTYLTGRADVGALLVTADGRQLHYGLFKDKAYVYSNDDPDRFIDLV